MEFWRCGSHGDRAVKREFKVDFDGAYRLDFEGRIDWKDRGSSYAATYAPHNLFRFAIRQQLVGLGRAHRPPRERA